MHCIIQKHSGWIFHIARISKNIQKPLELCNLQCSGTRVLSSSQHPQSQLSPYCGPDFYTIWGSTPWPHREGSIPTQAKAFDEIIQIWKHRINLSSSVSNFMFWHDRRNRHNESLIQNNFLCLDIMFIY